MKVEYRKLFLKDLKKLENQPIFELIIDLVFKQIPSVNCLQDLSQVKAMKGYPNRYRIRIGSYRLGIEENQDTIEIVRLLHRKEFYRYFP